MTTTLDVQGRRTILYVTNKSGGAVALGDVVIGDTSNDEAFTTTTTGAYLSSWVGVVIEANGIANNAAGRVCVQGYVSTITCNASVTRGNFIKTHTVAKQGTSAGSSRVAGVFAEALTTSATPSAVLFGMPDGSTGSAGSAGTPALTLSTTNATGSNVTLIATDATIAAFDATAPVTQAYGDAAATGSAGFAARRDHKHGMPAASGITFATQGTTSAGSSFATTRGTYAKKLTIASTCLVASIVAFVKGDGSTREGMAGLIYTDSSGPLNIVAVSGATDIDDGSHTSALFIPNTTVRAVTLPIGYVAAAGDYWFCFWMGDLGAHLSLAFNSGTGSDKTQAITGDAARDSSVTAFSSSSNDYCIYINTLR